MKILIEQSGYHLNNMGDVAMLQVAVSRLKTLWSDSEVYILTTAPERLEKYCPGTHPISPSSRDIWFSSLSKYSSRYKLVNLLASFFYRSGLECKLRRLSPKLIRLLLQYRLRKNTQLLNDFKLFEEAILNADLVVASGGGYINDIFPYNVNGVLNILELSVNLNKTTSMLGHGLGPLQDSKIFARAKSIIPFVKVVTLREKRAGLPLLKSIGVALERVTTTGDDAIEPAYQVHKEKLGNGIGVNLRISHYSDINSVTLEIVRKALHIVASQFSAPLVPVPISRHSDPGNEDPDSVAIQKLIEGYSVSVDGGYHLDTPLKVIENVSLCRVVVTASYHAAVFALSQGIPVVALAKSEYYVDKFLGLIDQFGVGCEVIFLSDQHLEEKLIESIRQKWSKADSLRAELLANAKHQVELGQAAYRRLYELVSSH